MGTVIFDISMSLDGFMTASGRTAEEPMGPGRAAFARVGDGRGRAEPELAGAMGCRGGSRHRWSRDLRHLGPVVGRGRALGSRTESAVRRDPRSAGESPEGSVYTFVTDGIESALEQAKAVAGRKNVTVMGGAELGRQYIAAGLVDEIQIHLVPVLFGAGTKMFDGLADDHIQLETVEVIQTPAAIHLRFRVLGRGARTDGRRPHSARTVNRRKRRLYDSGHRGRERRAVGDTGLVRT
jgi:dihydrofolate reductase